MSLRLDGSYRCDRCDRDVGNGAVTEAAIVVTLSEPEEDEPAYPITLHLCRVPHEQAPTGCAGHVLSESALKAWHDLQEQA